jgi:phage FluMu protein Com
MPEDPEKELAEIRKEGVSVIEAKCPMCKISK